MPLLEGKSHEIISLNIEELMRHGKRRRDQAVAIALESARNYGKKKKGKK